MDKLPDVFDLKKWVEENRDKLVPPTAAVTVLRNDKYMVAIVGGPNARTDYHVNQGAEFFYQIEGTMNLGVQENGEARNIPIGEGELYLLPPGTPHAPQRPANTIGLILESIREPGELDSYHWYCQNCNHLLFEKSAHMEVLERDMPPIFDAYYSDEKNQECDECGHINPGRPAD